MKCFIMDSSSIFRASPEAITSILKQGALYTTEEVSREVKASISVIRYKALMSRISVLKPSSSSVKKAKQMVRDLLNKLSEADISLLALAVELRSKCEEVVLITEDLWLQNAAKRLGIKAFGFLRRAKRTYKAVKVCLDCGNIYNAELEFCDNCGSNRYRIKLV